MKTPPDRSGITFEVGAQLEARDRHKNWYTATIEKIDYDKERVLIHYRQWSRRHDEWFQWNSPYLRPLERVSLRRQGLNPPRSHPMFVSGTKVLACWTDCRFYPAKILRVNKDDSYTVRFYDGVVRTVKPTKVKPFQEKSRSEKSAVGSEGWEEGESEEEEDGGEKEEEEEKKEEEAEEKVTSEERDGAVEGEEERKRKAEASSSHPPAKKKTDDSRSSGAENQPITVDSTRPAAPNPAHIDRDVLLERQAHLPTTHKFSREPLYRVIKNQPPPILSIELDHNPFKCPAAGCTKSFRKASLLHYHIKYYHSDQQLDERGSEQEAPRRKRSSSEGGDFVSDRKNENRNITCHRDDREHSTMGTGRTEGKRDGEREKTGGQNRKERKNFLRVKLKKKKKKKKKKKSQSGLGSSDDENSDRPPITLKLSTAHHDTHKPVDDGSDWSTLTAESGEDTASWPVAMETEECEVVRCVCEVDEENDFMIQCESCLCWQHGTCMGLYEDNIPHNYICYYCRHAAGWRRAQRFLSEPDFLISGHMFGLSCVKENYSEINASKITHTSRLLAHTHGLSQVLSGLQLKISLLHSPPHPDLQLWSLPWRREEGPRLTSSPRGDPAICYVSSEHCYQKPGASWEKAEEREKERQAAAAKQERHTEQKEIKPEDISKQVTDATTGDHRNTVTTTDTHSDSGIKTEKHTRADCEERTRTQTHAPGPRPASVAECQLNLLEHVESLHHQISARMDLIERELDVLESWLDHSGELEPPDPLSRLPQLKQRIGRLLRDLCTVRCLSVCR
ncbi:PHD finger protein 20-like isoform X3 [Xiphias gladius]|nr:PHD finger protein 20-like isoform X3 [Xiphias gladius]XP_040009199.1 PHD finger protein 20-like isoform X3 [Xiphias gladius]XP_040009200.1 PHD finger protein 20-like isoform X3 [Xiphias gladius]XP_040009201.1 PHD finger protein 20-like isoform X3 [Xiphias gladius]